MATYTAMPQVLEQQLSTIVLEISSPQSSASNTVFIIREALAQAYAAGHRDGHSLAHSLQWVTNELDTVYKDRAAASKAATPATESEPSS